MAVFRDFMLVHFGVYGINLLRYEIEGIGKLIDRSILHRLAAIPTQKSLIAGRGVIQPSRFQNIVQVLRNFDSFVSDVYKSAGVIKQSRFPKINYLVRLPTDLQQSRQALDSIIGVMVSLNKGLKGSANKALLMQTRFALFTKGLEQAMIPYDSFLKNIFHQAIMMFNKDFWIFVKEYTMFLLGLRKDLRMNAIRGLQTAYNRSLRVQYVLTQNLPELRQYAKDFLIDLARLPFIISAKSFKSAFGVNQVQLQSYLTPLNKAYSTAIQLAQIASKQPIPNLMAVPKTKNLILQIANQLQQAGIDPTTLKTFQQILQTGDTGLIPKLISDLDSLKDRFVVSASKALVFGNAIKFVGGIILAAIPSLMLFLRALYNAQEYLRETYKAALDLGISLGRAFKMVRFLDIQGYHIDAITQSVSKLSEALTTDPVAFRYMVAWLNLNPYDFLNRDAYSVILDIMQALDRIPDIAKRNAIARRLFNESWKDLYIMYKSGALRDAYEYSGLDEESATKYFATMVLINREISRLKVAFMDLGNSLVSALYPVFKMLISFIELLARNKYLFYSLLTLAGVLTFAFVPNPIVKGLGIGLAGTGLLGMFGELLGYSQYAGEQLEGLVDIGARQTTLLTLINNNIANMRWEINRFMASTARQFPDLYKGAIYRALINNVGGI